MYNRSTENAHTWKYEQVVKESRALAPWMAVVKVKKIIKADVVKLGERRARSRERPMDIGLAKLKCAERAGARMPVEIKSEIHADVVKLVDTLP